MTKLLVQKTIEQLKERKELLTQRAEVLKTLAEENRFELGLVVHQLKIQEFRGINDGKD
jgi:hypothetical protein